MKTPQTFRMLGIAGACLGIVLGAIGGALILARMGKEPPKREPTTAALLVDVVRPKIHQGSFIVRAQGTVTPTIDSSVVSGVSGQVIWVSEQFTAGGLFKADEELARIDDSDYRTALLAAEADLAAAEATLADELARSDAAREDFRRLYGDSRQPSDLTLRLPQVARARAAVQAQRAAVARAQRNLDQTRIRLPYDGIIVERSVDLGQYVTAGTALGQAFGTRRAEVRLPLAENDFAFLGLSPGSPSADIERELVLIGSVAGRQTEWPARLVRSAGVIDRNTRLSYVVAEIEDPYQRDAADGNERPPLPIGTFVEALIPGRDASGLMLLPAQALHAGDQVFLADAEDRLEVVDVEVVRLTPREVYVRGPLDADARVITTAIPAPVPGLKLNVRESEPAEEPRLRILPADGELAAETLGDG